MKDWGKEPPPSLFISLHRTCQLGESRQKEVTVTVQIKSTQKGSITHSMVGEECLEVTDTAPEVDNWQLLARGLFEAG